MRNQAIHAQLYINISADEKNELVLELQARGCMQVKRDHSLGPQQFSVDCWNPDPIDPCSTPLWIIEVGPKSHHQSGI